MSSFLLVQDSNLMLLEVRVKKLEISDKCPFQSIILSKYTVKFSVFDEEFIDIQPQRTDYKPYIGSCGEVHLFHGGKSVLFPVTSCFLRRRNFEDEIMCVNVTREKVKEFDIPTHETTLGSCSVKIDKLLNGIVEELEERDKLDDLFKPPHEKDPISRSMKATYVLKPEEDCGPRPCTLELYVRFSYLGSSVITEIDRPSKLSPCTLFYAQEQSNRVGPYELREFTRQVAGPPCKEMAKVCDDKDVKEVKDAATETREIAIAEKVVVSEVENKAEDKKEEKKKKPVKPRGGSGGGASVGFVDEFQPCEEVEPICCKTECVPVDPCYSPCYPEACDLVEACY